MATTTPLQAIPIPTSGDADDVPADFATSFGYVEGLLVMRFASASARAATITSPVEGMASWLQDTNSFEVYNGAAWRQPWNAPWGCVGRAQVTASQGSITGVVDLTSLSISFTAVANRVYKVTFDGSVDSSVSGDTAGVWLTDSAGAVIYAYSQTKIASAGSQENLPCVGYTTALTAGTQVIKARGARVAGTGNIAFQASGTSAAPGPMSLIVEDIGPSSTTPA